MEIKCKVSFALPEELINALNITEDTAIYASFSEGRVVLEIADDEDDYTEDDLYDEDDDCGDGECDCCEYFCPHCGKCVLN